MPRFAVVDVETSGLSSRRHRILQIGLVTVEADGTVVDQWSSLVRLRWPWSRVGPRRVHGITRRTLRGAPARPPWRSPSCAGGSTANVFTAHNADFDAAFIERAAARSSLAMPLGPRLCTLQLSRRLDPERQLTHGLADVTARYDVTIERHHDALCDARATAAVLPHLLAAHGVVDAADLERLYVSRTRHRAGSGTGCRGGSRSVTNPARPAGWSADREHARCRAPARRCRRCRCRRCRRSSARRSDRWRAWRRRSSGRRRARRRATPDTAIDVVARRADHGDRVDGAVAAVREPIAAPRLTPTTDTPVPVRSFTVSLIGAAEGEEADVLDAGRCPSRCCRRCG